jgi:hypothetical protein
MCSRIILVVFATLLFSSSIFAFDVYADLWKVRRKGFTNWTLVGSIDDHEGFAPSQPWKLWSNFTVNILTDISALQITAAEKNDSVPRVNGVFCANMPFYGVVDYYTFFSSIVSWGPPLNIYAGVLN